MHSQELLGDQDLQLVELSEQRPLELSDEARAAPRAEVQHGHDDDLVQVQAGAALPEALQREVA
jgi:hypothetical protein